MISNTSPPLGGEGFPAADIAKAAEIRNIYAILGDPRVHVHVGLSRTAQERSGSAGTRLAQQAGFLFTLHSTPLPLPLGRAGMRTVVALCNRTINMVQPWLDGGYRAITVDRQPAEGEHRNRLHIQADVLALADDFAAQFEPCAVFAFPPCTHLAVSGARWFRDKGLSALIEGLQLVDKCRRICEASGARWMLENPVGTIASYWRDPDHAFDPNDYGDPYTKKTCLWTGGGFVMPAVVRPGDLLDAPTWVEPTEGSMIHLMPPSDDRGDRRSITPMGFAHAAFRANAIASDEAMTSQERTAQ